MGILQVALSERGVKGLRKTAANTAQWIDQAELAALEPALGHARGAMFNPDDGAVDNVGLMSALEAAAGRSSHIEQIADSAVRVVSRRDSVSVMFAGGQSVDAGFVVLAPGAWGGLIEGAPLLDAVRPSRGQLISYGPIDLHHVVYGPRGYLVPRTAGTLPASTVAGSTTENAGFVSETTPEGLARVASAAAEIAPALLGLEPSAAWAGLRPVTPDMLPLLGADPSNPRLIYSCGHSRNGILMAALSGEVAAALVTGEEPLYDLSPFHPARFSG
jgi:glycine oxidase